jgi:hypothetical protein
MAFTDGAYRIKRFGLFFNIATLHLTVDMPQLEKQRQKFSKPDFIGPTSSKMHTNLFSLVTIAKE